ncbi:MAG: hypothetical protein DRH57_03475 [Candidatus Cloacimonadota bacterium]|nr:MAG: hypothetical protein DRH57_03475 [Candidatus Cloacimonadota bacterium]
MKTIKITPYNSITFIIILFTALFSQICTSLPSNEKIKLKISYLNLNIVNVYVNFFNEKDNKQITILVNSSGISNAFIKICNKYQCLSAENFLPFIYTKEIHQSNYQEQCIIQYKHKTKEALKKDILNGINEKYTIKNNTYDFFSGLFYIRSQDLQVNDSISFFVDANAVIWKIRAVMIKKDKLKTKIGTFDAIKCQITFERISKKKRASNSDILTNNLVSEKNKLYLWFSDDDNHIPLKAVYDMFPFNVAWKIEDYQ